MFLRMIAISLLILLTDEIFSTELLSGSSPTTSVDQASARVPFDKIATDFIVGCKQFSRPFLSIVDADSLPESFRRSGIDPRRVWNYGFEFYHRWYV